MKASSTTGRTAQLGRGSAEVIVDPTDAVVRIASSTICGTDLHILKGDVRVKPRTILGHEAN